ncbi:ABC transporter ATP-binding protein [Solitalea koreensis]|uniref:Putative ABC transport system ATP-binding protein n=1 Tax=Solitalea koreensis TaxID=543615 RepID=A0A521BDY5_9SPHI|nr:ATP-binding cassette domain-containing protein [Solitalea koreensis]SMO44940.1 putative ABC transport system ATP-binding protein [Solitalea koreensis]
MIELKNVSKTFNKGKANEVNALKNTSIKIEKGEFVVVIGENGSGKSTFLNLVAGNIYPSEGNIYLQGEDVTKLPEFGRSRWIARVFQNPLSGTASELSILTNFRLASLRTQRKKMVIGTNRKFVEKVKEQVSSLNMGLENKLEQSMGSLSGGQRQALTLLMSVMDEAKILLLDEPTAALDPRSAQLILKTADQLITQYGLTAVLVTHNLKDAYTHGNRILQFSEGEIIRDISSSEKEKIQQTDLYAWFE